MNDILSIKSCKCCYNYNFHFTVCFLFQTYHMVYKIPRSISICCIVFYSYANGTNNIFDIDIIYTIITYNHHVFYVYHIALKL
jgi:hypothetical protein